MDTLTRLKQGTHGDKVLFFALRYHASYEKYVSAWKLRRELVSMEEPVVREVYEGFYNELFKSNKIK